MILARATNLCWFCFKWGLLAGAIAVAVGAFHFHDKVDEEIRHWARQRLAEAYPQLEVSVESATRVKGKGIELRGVSIAERGAEGPRAELVYFQRMFFACATDLKELIDGAPDISQITISRPVIRVTRRLDGTLSTEKLLPLPKFGDCRPKVTIENGTIEIFDPTKTPCSTWTVRDVSFTLYAPDPSAPNPHLRKLQGTFSADHLHWGEVVGQVDTETQAWSIGGSVEGINVSPELREALPEPIAQQLAALGELRGRGALGYRVDYHPPSESEAAMQQPAYRFALTAKLKRGEVNVPGVPDPLTIRHATISFGNGPMRDRRTGVRLSQGGIVVEDLSAAVGDATVRIWGHQAGFQWGQSPLHLETEIRQLELDDRVLRSLPPRLKQEWDKYRPLGGIDVNATLVFDGKRWYPEAHVRCLDVSFTHHNFDYRLQHGQGSVDLKNDRLEVHVTAYSRNRPVRVDAEIENASSAPVGWFHVQARDLPLDEDMIGALKDEHRAVVRSFNPHGTIDFDMKVWRNEAKEAWHKQTTLDLKDCDLCFKNFPYPLSHVWGRISALDKHWTFHRNLVGRNDTGVVRVDEGWMRPLEAGPMLYLRLTGESIPLEEELRAAHAENIQRIWADLQPEGKVDAIAEIIYRPSIDRQPVPGQPKRLEVNVTAYPHRDGASIKPVSFPYRMNKLDGELIYRDGRLTVRGRNPGQRFTAEHGQVELAANCRCDFLPDGSWEFHVEDLVVDRLRLDHELVGALPAKLREGIVGLKPTGANDHRNGFELNLTGGFSLRSGVRPGDPVQSRWNLAMDFAQGEIDCGVKLENLHGGARLWGASDGQRFESLGELAIDSATYQDYQFTDLRGPLLINNQRIVFGTLVAREPRDLLRDVPREQPRPLTARLCGGNVYADASVTLDPRQIGYRIRAHLARADLARCAQEVMAGRQNLRGKVMAYVDLQGTGKSLNGMRGEGMIWLREADVYELPVIVALLKILSAREPDQTAFRESDIAFRIRGNHVYFDPINFRGDAISLLGEGQLDLNSKKIDLTFHSVVGNDRFHLPLIHDVMGGASRQILEIDVTGTLQDPKTTKRAFPFLSEFWQRVQEERQMRANYQGRFGPAGPHVFRRNGIMR